MVLYECNALVCIYIYAYICVQVCTHLSRYILYIIAGKYNPLLEYLGEIISTVKNLHLNNTGNFSFPWKSFKTPGWSGMLSPEDQCSAWSDCSAHHKIKSCTYFSIDCWVLRHEELQMIGSNVWLWLLEQVHVSGDSRALISRS